MIVCKNYERNALMPKSISKKHDFRMPPPRKEMIKKLIIAASVASGVEPITLQNCIRQPKYAHPRFCIMHYLKRQTTMTLYEISSYCGNKHHSTVIFGIKRVDDALNGYDPKLKAMYEEILKRMA